MTNSEPDDPKVITTQTTESEPAWTPPPGAPSTESPPPVAPPIVTQRTTVSTSTSTSGPEMGRRVVILLFGLIQIVIGLRVVLLLLDAREGNALVSFILDLSQLFVGPFDGVLHTNALQQGGSILDLAAIVALVGWTILELIVLWTIGLFRREPA